MLIKRRYSSPTCFHAFELTVLIIWLDQERSEEPGLLDTCKIINAQVLIHSHEGQGDMGESFPGNEQEVAFIWIQDSLWDDKQLQSSSISF